MTDVFASAARRYRISAPDTEHVRILVANERHDHLAAVTKVVRDLGHEVVEHENTTDEVAEATRRSEPDLALVAVGSSSAHALELIDRISAQVTCPVIAILDVADERFVSEAARAGVFAYVVGDDRETWRNTIEIVLHRFADYRNLHAAFGRRALIERAKGILMERHGLREAAAFELLRREARSTNRRVVDVAAAVLEGHPLLPGHDS